MKNQLGGKIMTKLSTLRGETYSYLTHNKDENKKAKDRKTCVVKKGLKFEDYKHCLESTQLENKINKPENNKTDVNILRENKKEFIKSNKLILKSKQRFKN